MQNLDFSVLLPYINLLPAALKVTIIIGVCGFALAIVIAIVIGSLRSCRLPKIFSLNYS